MFLVNTPGKQQKIKCQPETERGADSGIGSGITVLEWNGKRITGEGYGNKYMVNGFNERLGNTTKEAIERMRKG
jgi:hypothetical protein